MKNWDMLWIDANLATLEDNGQPYGAIEKAAIAVKGNQIAWIGLQSELQKPYEDLAVEIYSAENHWITPGLIDCHTHLVYGDNRCHEFELRLEGATYEEIAKANGGIRSTVAFTRKLDEETLFQQSAKRLKSLLAEGVTTIEIKSGYGLTLESECKMLKVAKRLGETFPVDVQKTFLGAHALPDEFIDKPDAYIDWICNTALPYVKAHELADAVDAFCEHIGFSYEQVRRIFEVSRELHLPVKLHADQLSDSNGAALAAEFNALSADHLEYVSEQSLIAMAKSGTVAVLLPGAFYYLREKRKPPINAIRENQIPIAIATDSNPGTSPTTSILTVLNMACTLFRLTPEEALKGVTINAAKALGLDQIKGSLKPGKQADFVIWDIQRPAELSYWVGYNPLLHVVKSGLVV